jgi:MraZ protein
MAVTKSSQKVLDYFTQNLLTNGKQRITLALWWLRVTEWNAQGGLGMFCGGDFHSIDDKSRIIVPLKHRLQLGERFFITRGLNGCLWVLGQEQFQKLGQQLDAQPAFSEHAVLLERVIFADAVETTADSQGRVFIPADLCKHAGLEKEVKIVGTRSRVEIWSKDRWSAYMESIDDDLIKTSLREVGLG